MKKWSLIIVQLVLMYGAVWCQQPSIFSYDQISESEKNAAQQKALLQAEAFTDNYNLVYQRCQWNVDPDTLLISGNITSYFIPNENGFQQIQFDCSDSLIIDSIHFHQASISIVQPFKNILKIDLPLIPIATLDSVSVFYHGIPAANGFGSFVKDQHNGQNIIWTLSEPYGARDWWPCKQSLNDKIDSADFIISTPLGVHAGCAGLLVDSNVVANKNVWHWKTHYPIATYLIGFAVTNYDQFSLQIPLSVDTVTLLNYVFPEYYQQALTDVQPIVQAMKLYDSLFVTYPFANEKYGHMQFTWPGGMEHQTMSSMANLNFELVVHEMAHQWFGDKITCSSWHDIWLNEGFATYLTDLCYQYMFNGQWWNSWKSQTIDHIISQPNGSVYCDDTTSVSRIFSSTLSYRKGSYLLHMLRWELGDDAFFNGMRAYLNDPQLAYGFANTSALQVHLENACGYSLNKFFKNWFYGQGWPTYNVEWSEDENDLLHIRLSQTTSDSSVNFFPMHVPVEIKGAAIDSVLVMNHNLKTQDFTFQLTGKVDSVLFDPNLELISGNNVVTHLPVFESNENLFAWPNPTHDFVWLSFDPTYYNNFMVKIYDEEGRLVSQGIPKIISPSMVQINLKDFAIGNYFLFLPGVEKGIFKIVKQ